MALLPLLALWVALMALGMKLQMDYDRAPGASGDVPAGWPSDSRLARPARSPVWILFAHPRCPCTRASLDELELLRLEAPEPVRTLVLFSVPAGADGDWSEGDAWRRARAIDGAEVRADLDGAEARRFGARTSGHAFHYDPSGRLLFQGGLTPGRGTTSDARARRAAAARWREGRSSESAPVYGCPLAIASDTP